VDSSVRLAIGPDRAVAPDEPRLPHVEPHLALDPSRPGHLVIATMVRRDGRMTVDVVRSTDGGERWDRRRFPECFADPWVVLGAGDRAWFTCAGHADGPTPQLVFRSSDGGRSWLDPVRLDPAGHSSFDHASMLVMPGTPHDTLLVIGMQGTRGDDPPLAAPFVARSTDGGVTFGVPRRVVWSGVMSNPANPVRLAAGTVAFPVVDFSTDGRTPLERRRVWWVRWDFGSERPSIPYLMAEVGVMSTLPLVARSVVPGGDEVLHLAYDDVRDGEPGIFLVSSRDGGRTWTQPRPLARGERGDDAASFANPVVAAGAGGEVAVAWYERPVGSGEGCWVVRAAGSRDGGVTFTVPATVSSESFCVHQPENVPSRRWPAGGDYFGLAASGPAAFRVVWADARSGLYQLRTATMRVGAR
jgi:hypothetical protein